ncbi:hypothetical protein M407DRAFT_241761 [Tulasnella calospora MUT 4182]|uniref:Uncharacterized protein n=1 Tax=Tulasnella calospora MUT 4182 TaxID=1051891 RepID=A0A0C3LC68_9AGAM|nr:hypothetical protein M407DRAFT_241761 [Tulasnella calospora MUT 4182]
MPGGRQNANPTAAARLPRPWKRHASPPKHFHLLDVPKLSKRDNLPISIVKRSAVAAAPI